MEHLKEQVKKGKSVKQKFITYVVLVALLMSNVPAFPTLAHAEDAKQSIENTALDQAVADAKAAGVIITEGETVTHSPKTEAELEAAISEAEACYAQQISEINAKKTAQKAKNDAYAAALADYNASLAQYEADLAAYEATITTQQNADGKTQTNKSPQEQALKFDPVQDTSAPIISPNVNPTSPPTVMEMGLVGDKKWQYTLDANQLSSYEITKVWKNAATLKMVDGEGNLVERKVHFHSRFHSFQRQPVDKANGTPGENKNPVIMISSNVESYVSFYNVNWQTQIWFTYADTGEVVEISKLNGENGTPKFYYLGGSLSSTNAAWMNRCEYVYTNDATGVVINDGSNIGLVTDLQSEGRTANTNVGYANTKPTEWNSPEGEDDDPDKFAREGGVSFTDFTTDQPNFYMGAVPISTSLAGGIYWQGNHYMNSDEVAFVAFDKVKPIEPVKPEPETYEFHYHEIKTSQKATIKYVVEGDETNPLETDSKSGKSGEVIPFNTAERIKYYEDRGYEVVSNDFVDDTTYDNNLDIDQDFTVVLRPILVPVTPDKPQVPGTPINPKDPDSPVWPDGTDKDSLEKEVKQVVKYQYEDGSEAAPDVTDKVTFEKTLVVNKVTGEIVDTIDWKAKNDDTTFDAKTSPVIDGYTASKDASDEITGLTQDSADDEQIIIYRQIPEKATIKYVVETTNELLDEDAVSGLPEAPIEYTTAEKIKYYEDRGYELVSDGFPEDAAYDNDPTVDQEFVVVLKPILVPVTPDEPQVPGTPINPEDPDSPVWPDGTDKDSLEKEVKQVVKYQYEDGSEAAPDVTDKVTFEKTLVVNKVTGEIVDTIDWKAKNDDTTFDAKTSPVIDGYTASKDASDEITGLTQDSADDEQIIIYRQIPEKATIKYVVETTNELLDEDAVSGLPEAPIEYTTAEKIKYYEDRGYELVSDGFPEDAAYDNDPTVDQEFVVVLKPILVPVTPDEPQVPGTPINPEDPDSPVWPDGTDKDSLEKEVKQVVKYQYEDGSEAAPDVTDKVTFEKTLVVNKVTGEIVDTIDWKAKNDDTTFDAKTSPVIDGYTASKDASDEITGLTQDSADDEQIIIYRQIPEKATIKYVVETTNELLDEDAVSGLPEAPIEYTTAEKIKYYEDRGYELVSDGFPEDAAYDNDPTVDQEFVVVLKPILVPVTPDEPQVPGTPINPEDPDSPVWPDGTDKDSLEKEVKQVVKYQYEDGSEAAPDVTDKVTFEKTLVVNKVTGEIVDTIDWKAKNDDTTFDAKTSPVIDGYTASKDASDEITGLTQDSADNEQIIIYVKDTIPTGDVVVKYVEEGTTTELEPSETVKDGVNVGEDYSTDPKLIDGYVLTKTPDNAAGQVTEGTTTVVYEYKPVGKLVPSSEDPDFPNPGNTTYPNDPDDPAKVGKVVVPDVPGYTPQYPDGTPVAPGTEIDPEDPTKDTPIIYVKDPITTGDVIVKYVEEGTTTELEPSETVKDGVNVGEDYSTDPKLIDGYVLTKTPDNAAGQVTEGTTTVVYEYKPVGKLVPSSEDPDFPNPGNTTYPNDPDDPAKVGKVVVPDVPGYTPQYPDGTPVAPGTEIDPEDPTKDTPIIYVKDPDPVTDGKVVVNYVDEEGKPVADTEETQGKIGDPYTTAAKDIDGYDYLRVEGDPAEGTYAEGTKTVTYVYKKVTEVPAKGSVTAKYVDESGNEIAPPESQVGDIDQPWTTVPKDISDYELIRTEGAEAGTYTEEPQEVIYVYTKKVVPAPKGTLVVEYVDETTGEPVTDGYSAEGVTGDPYTTDSKVVNGYVLTVTPDNKDGSYTEGETKVSYKYKPVGKLVPSSDDPDFPNPGNTTYPNDPDDPAKVGKVVVPNVPGYTPQYPDGTPVAPGTEIDPEDPTKDTPIIYVKDPVPITEGKVVVNYVDEDGNPIPGVDPDGLTGQLGDKYTTKPKDIPGYVLVEEKLPANADGEFTEDDITVTYVYKKIEDPTPEVPDTTDKPAVPGKPSTPAVPGKPSVSAVPKTGDGIMGFLALGTALVLSSGTLAALRIRRRKEEKTNK